MYCVVPYYIRLTYKLDEEKGLCKFGQRGGKINGFSMGFEIMKTHGDQTMQDFVNYRKDGDETSL